MLQYLAEPNDRYSLAEQAQMAIEGGCAWIVIALPEGSEDELRPDVADTIALCRESGVILTLLDRPELARELGIFGVLMTGETPSAAALREQLGPEAMIGYPVRSAAGARLLEQTDIDYGVVLPGTPHAPQIISEARQGGVQLPIVAMGEFSPADIPGIVAEGFSGVVAGRWIADAPDPVAATAEMLERLMDKSDSK